MLSIVLLAAACGCSSPSITGPNVRALARSTDRNYCTCFEALKAAAIEAIEEEAHVTYDQIEITGPESGCSSCGGNVVYLKAPYIEFSHIKVKIDDRGKDSGMPELSVSVTTDKTFFTRHMNDEQRIHDLVLLKLQSRQHGEESRVPGHVKTAILPTLSNGQPGSVIPYGLPESAPAPSTTPPPAQGATPPPAPPTEPAKPATPEKK